MKKGLKKALEAAQTALEKATKENDFEAMKKATVEADKLFKAFLKEAQKAAYQGESEDEDETESESESKDMCGEDETESESDGDSHTVTTHKVVKKTGKAAVPQNEDEGEADDAGKDKKDDSDDDDAVESKREIILMKAKEAGVELSKSKIEKLIRLPIKEAKEEIADLKAMRESIVKQVIKQIRVPVATIGKIIESNRDEEGSQEGKSFLESCIR